MTPRRIILSTYFGQACAVVVITFSMAMAHRAYVRGQWLLAAFNVAMLIFNSGLFLFQGNIRERMRKLCGKP
jgi:hypothetical protein